MEHESEIEATRRRWQRHTILGFQQIAAFVVLHDHHRDVVELQRIGQRHQHPIRRVDRGRLAVVDPVADISDAGAPASSSGGQSVCANPGPSQPTGAFR